GIPTIWITNNFVEHRFKPVCLISKVRNDLHFAALSWQKLPNGSRNVQSFKENFGAEDYGVKAGIQDFQFESLTILVQATVLIVRFYYIGKYSMGVSSHAEVR